MPRRAVIDQAWRAIGPGVEVLSGVDGGPLRRTVKRILDPLVLRLRSNPRFSASVLTADEAAAMVEVIVDHAPQLRCTAGWFALLKVHRRRLRITTGNAQDLYFPVCFELAVTRGPPPQDDDAARFAESELRRIHDDRDRTAIEVLNRYVDDQDVIDARRRTTRASWRDVRPSGTSAEPFLAGLTTVLGSADGHVARTARQRVWSALVADATPHDLGARARIPRVGCHGPSSTSGSARPNLSPLRRCWTAPRVHRPLDRSVWIGCERRCAVDSTVTNFPTSPRCAPRRSTGPVRHGVCWRRTSRPRWSQASRSR